jgi:hypothetical protein
MIELNHYERVALAEWILGVSDEALRSWAQAGEIPMHPMDFRT